MTMEPLDLTPSIKKKLVRDAMPCDQVDRFLRVMGLFPGSPEVEEMEHRASHHRLNQVAPINPMLLQVASLSGEVIGRGILENQGIAPDEELIASYQKVARAAAQTVIANLIDMNLLHIGGHP
jgi:hypothetical protein